ncbi:MAG: hypothetical protein M1821_001759 [Bathelium mastoideum]|nr:MAG: hypothetical protein M1821_001759 [Bathelium mastoideum]
MAPGIQILRRAGVLEDVRRAGFLPGTLTFRKLDGTAIVSIEDVAQSRSPDAMTVLPIGELGKIMVAQAQRNSNISVLWSHEVTSVGQDEKSAWVVVKDRDGLEKEIVGDFLCGCDGASSQVRKSLFGARSFPGKTWDAQLVATNVYYPFEKFGYDDMNFFVDPQECHIIARLTKDGLWRVSYPEDSKMAWQEVIKNQPAHYERLLPGHPKPADYKITNISPYRMHQRCAQRFRVGRICLAGDAAHLCNPWGGLGLTGGFADVMGLAECLEGIHTGLADHSILNKYDEVRRSVFLSITDPVSTANYQRASTLDPDTALEQDPVLSMCAAAKTEPRIKEELDKSAYALCHDFTQYYSVKT